MLEIRNLSKKYFNKEVLKDINFTLNDGKVLGLLGENGSGKTTLMKIIANVIRNYSGIITLDGEEISFKTANYISYLPDIDFLEKEFSVESAIKLYKSFFSDFDFEKSQKLLRELNIPENKRIKELSKGMREKLYLLLVLSRNAKLYLLDEPIAGVDIITRKNIMKVILENISENSSVIITTHLIREIENLFDEVCFIKDGKLSQVYNVEDIRKSKGMSVEDLYIKIYGEGVDIND